MTTNNLRVKLITGALCAATALAVVLVFAYTPSASAQGGFNGGSPGGLGGYDGPGTAGPGAVGPGQTSTGTVSTGDPVSPDGGVTNPGGGHTNYPGVEHPGPSNPSPAPSPERGSEKRIGR